MRIPITGFLSILVLNAASCSNDTRSYPVAESHSAYPFYRLASSGPTTLEMCHSFGGIEILPIDYEKAATLGQGVFTITHKSTGKRFLAISWSEGGIVSTINTCCWPLEN
jgi:hypothetical protein